MKKILVIGGNGFVGGQLCKMGEEKGYQIAVADIADACVVSTYEYYKCDISDYAAILDIFQKCKPTLIVNVAAIADIDLAERKQELAYAVNVTGAENCSRAAKQIGAKYVWFSSDAIFDGAGTDYTEDIAADPVNYYGKTKALGEERVMAANENAIILRLSLVLGMPVAAGNSFLAGMLKKVQNNEKVVCPVNEVRTPVDVLTLCEAIYELDGTDFSGVMHLGSTSSVNRYDMTCYIAQLIHAQPELIVPLHEPVPGKAPRHNNGIICVAKAQSVLKTTTLLPWQKTVERAVSMINN